ncbi:MAG: pyridoxamine 5'-phosphate oxidase [Microbacteriaceae bacterium]
MAEDPLAAHADYTLGTLDESSVDADPLVQLRRWLSEAAESGLVAVPNAFVLGTVDPDGSPSARTVLLRGLGSGDGTGDGPAPGLEFFTNRRSHKGVALERRPEASALFPWYPLQRQLIVVGRVERLTEAEDDAYWAGRPRASRLASRASRQSQPVGSRAELDALVAAEEAALPPDAEVPRPAHWGGYRIVPRRLELWQGRAARLHDRLLYRRDANGAWRVIRLQP